jgi:polyisoprenoid-binding protein YceI
MKAILCLALCSLSLPLAVLGAEHPLKVDPSRTFIDVDVKATMDSFTAHLDAYDTKFTVDDAGKIKTAVLTFKFADLKTGKADRDKKMIAWLGGGNPEGRFELGNLAVMPDGQGQASGRLSFHLVTELVEFPVTVEKADGTYTASGEATVDYRTWNLKPIRLAMGVVKVDPEVKIRFKFTATPVEEAKN